MQQNFDLTTRCVGIVGVGNVGGRLKARLEAMGVRCICNDPLHDDEEIPGLVHLDELVAQADIISLHTPLTQTGDHPTYHLFNAENLAQIKASSILINSSRGSVIDNAALEELLAQRPDITAVLDVWEGEPDISLSLLAKVALATPHIAGYSLDGKINGTRMIYQALCRSFELPETIDVDGLAPVAATLDGGSAYSADVKQAVFDLLLQCYDVRNDDKAFRQAMTADRATRIANFDALRKNYPVRRELGVTAVRLNEHQVELQQQLTAFGFKC